MATEDRDRLAKLALPAAITFLAVAVLVHALVTKPVRPTDEIELDGKVTISNPNGIPVAAAPFDPEGGAIIRTAGHGWYIVHPDGMVTALGHHTEIARRAKEQQSR